ncbi:MAG: DNA repair and recombination protein RadB [Nanoarchaeota archaeon]
MESKLESGCNIIDEFLEGGFEKDVVSTIFGPAGAGKTTICLIASINTAKTKKVIYIDTEGSFSVERVKQLLGNKEVEKVLGKIMVLKPTTFEQQQKAIDQLREMVSDKVGLVIIDTIAMLYRAEMGNNEDYQQVNKMLAKQMAELIRIARDKGVPVIVTNQVYADFENKNAVHLVGGDVTKYGSKCLIELQILHNSRRKAILRKHRHIPERELFFEIKNDNLVKASEESEKQKKAFRLF